MCILAQGKVQSASRCAGRVIEMLAMIKPLAGVLLVPLPITLALILLGVLLWVRGR